MGLKIVGSNPTIYPFMYGRVDYKTVECTKLITRRDKFLIKDNKKFKTKNVIKLYWYVYFYTLVTLSYNYFYKNPDNWFFYIYSHLKIFENLNTLLSYKSLHKFKPKPVNSSMFVTRFGLRYEYKFDYRELFRIFLKMNTTAQVGLLKVNSSWKSFFIDHGGSIQYVLLGSLFIKFKLIINMLSVIYFFDLKILYFSNAFFRDEVNSLNWSNFKSFIKIWRRVLPFFTFKFGRIFDKAWIIFYKLRLEGYYVALVIDIQYHIKTLHYLNRAQYYTIGFVPLWYNSNLVHFAIPMSSHGAASQLFVFRFLILIIKDVKKNKYFNNFKIWSGFKKVI